MHIKKTINLKFICTYAQNRPSKTILCKIKYKKRPAFSGGAQFLAFLLSQDLSSLHDFDDLGKCCRIGDGQVSENLAVHVDVSLGKLVNELAIADAEFTNSSVQASDPQRAEITLLVAAVCIGILTSVGNGVNSKAKVRLAAAIVTLGGLEDFFAAFAGRNSSFCAWHSYSPYATTSRRLT